MPIQVTCPGCLKRFQVNDKFSGKTGPCPSCSKPITIPAKNDEVVIHSPENEGPKDAKGRPVFKPLRRQDVKITLPAALATGAIAVISLGVALLIRFSADQPPTAVLVLGVMLLAPPLVYAGYWFLRDDELGGFQGTELLIRCGIVSAIFALTWAIYAGVPMYVGGFQSLSEIEVPYVMLVVPAMVLLGAAASILALELETMQGALHYLLYFAVTLALALIMGTQIATPFADEPSRTPGVRAPGTLAPTIAPNGSAGTKSNAQPSAAANSGNVKPTPQADPNAPKKPRLLQ